MRNRTRPIAWVNWAIVVLNVAYFIVLELGGSSLNADYMVQMGAVYPPAILEGHEYYRLLTSVFMHFGISHLFNNMLVLVFLGDNLERALGHINYLLFYLLAGIGSSLVSVFYYAEVGRNVVSAGASGAIFGVVGGLICIVAMNRGRLEDLTSRQLIFLAALSLYHGFTSIGVSNVAHVSGLVLGLILGFILYPRSHMRENLRRREEERALKERVAQEGAGYLSPRAREILAEEQRPVSRLRIFQGAALVLMAASFLTGWLVFLVMSAAIYMLMRKNIEKYRGERIVKLLTDECDPAAFRELMVFAGRSGFRTPQEMQANLLNICAADIELGDFREAETILEKIREDSLSPALKISYWYRVLQIDFEKGGTNAYDFHLKTFMELPDRVVLTGKTKAAYEVQKAYALYYRAYMEGDLKLQKVQLAKIQLAVKCPRDQVAYQYWLGCTRKQEGDLAGARQCFSYVASSGNRTRFAQLAQRKL